MGCSRWDLGIREGPQVSQALAEKSPSNSSLLLEKLQEPPHIPGWKSRPRKKGFHWKTAWKKAGKRNFGAKNNPNKGNYPGGGDKKNPWIPPGGWGWGREWWERLWNGSFGNFGVAGSQRRPGRGTKSLLCLRRNPEKVVLQFPERLENRGKKKKKKLELLFQLPFPGFFSLLLRSRREFQHRDFGDGGREALRSKSSWSVPEKGGKNAGLSQRIPKIPGFRCWRHLGIKIFPNQAPNYPELSQTSSSPADFGSWHHLGIQIFPNRAPQPQKRERKKLDYPKAFPKQLGLAPGPI